MAPGAVVLVVEDEEPNRVLLRAVLGRATDERLKGLTLLEAPDMATARQILDTQRVDLVLLDVRLPDGNGLTLINEERAGDWAAPKFIVLSASVLPTEREAAIATGASEFLAKPYRPSELVGTIAEFLETTSAEAG
jgi:two-component system KDP operon response regulator KdpE